VIHVRRADVVLHGKFSRRYHPIREYVDALCEDERRLKGEEGGASSATVCPELLRQKPLLLLTDDSNAIKEALAQYPQLKWQYIDRPRHRGSEGGWENQIPSGDPASEVVALHAAFTLARRCNVIVHTKSNLADYLYAVMTLANPMTRRLDLDRDRPHGKIHSQRNAETVSLSREDWR